MDNSLQFSSAGDHLYVKQHLRIAYVVVEKVLYIFNPKFVYVLHADLE